MTQPRTLLTVLAHPDDESFGMGGILARYAREGVQVHYACATRGEAGSVDEHYLQNYPTIADLRTAELTCAAKNLGLAQVHYLGYRDSGMPGSPDNANPAALVNAPVEEVAQKVAALIRRLRPQVVITFDPIGGYKHPDHIAIHKATVRAFSLAADAAFISDAAPYQPQKLYFHLFPKGFLKFVVILMRLLLQNPRKFGRNRDIDLQTLVEEGNFPTHAIVRFSREDAAAKLRASECHASQGGAQMTRGFAGWIRQLGGRRDTFMRAYPQVTSNLREDDLFA